MSSFFLKVKKSIFIVFFRPDKKRSLFLPGTKLLFVLRLPIVGLLS